jgi:hypothetical protein
MPSLLNRLIGAGPASLAQRLKAYPAFNAPHAGPATEWTQAQAEANLAYLVAHRDERLQALGGLLAVYGIDPAPALEGRDPGPLLDALHAWAKENWPALHDPKLATRERWQRTSRRGDEIVYALLMDVAILLGELIVRQRPDFRWALDVDDENARDGMTSYHRPVLIAHRQGDGGQVELDIEEIVVSRYLQPRNPALVLLNGWKQVVTDAVTGAYERPLNGASPG